MYVNNGYVGYDGNAIELKNGNAHIYGNEIDIGIGYIDGEPDGSNGNTIFVSGNTIIHTDNESVHMENKEVFQDNNISFYGNLINIDETNEIVSPFVLPRVDASDNGKFLRVVDGEWVAVTVDNAEGASF